MSEREQLIVFCYDVSKTSIRNRISKLLEDHGTRVQYSIFECRMKLSKAEKLFSSLELLRDENDGLRMYVIPEDGRRRSRASGAPIAEKTEFWLF